MAPSANRAAVCHPRQSPYPTHRATELLLFALAHPRGAFVFQPAYAADLNLLAGVWKLLKRVELRNRCCRDLDELGWELGLAIRRLRRRTQRLVACFRQCGYLQ